MTMRFWKRSAWGCVSALLLLASCVEENTDTDEWANWEARNDSAVVRWYADGSLTKLKTYAKDQSVTGQPTDYVYVEQLENGAGTECPIFTDTVLIHYRGHYIPTASYPEGYVFDQSYIGNFSWATAGVSKFVVSGVVEGFSTALMHMHKGDRWRVYIPYVLGYGATSTSSTLPNATNLVFDIALVDFWHPGDKRPAFRVRQRE